MKNFMILNANIACLGFFILPIIPVGYSFSIELTYPVSEVMSNGIIMLFSQFIGTIVTYVGTVVAQKDPLYVVMIFGSMIASSGFAALMIKEDLRRLNLGKQMEGKDRLGHHANSILPEKVLSSREEKAIEMNDPDMSEKMNEYSMKETVLIRKGSVSSNHNI